ncbi:hypothetical protein G6045_18890 [Streptomyces sp. YC504]|uniref:Lysozyme inhibitor LprI N-terminal domain-containing protein n=1 Tax=Streptomyces mesophilus TaxID=1775132 RepID=A0A6G4XLL1_9ACTN|nr:hypothetical protein [Streptomyces mesophilus]NGO77710.1 hypothetical protein [Streptomyces mesophilus]
MAHRHGIRAAVVAASFLALVLPASLAHADAAPKPKNCNAYQKTVNRHQESADKLDERFAAEQAKSDALYDAVVDATGEVDWIMDSIGDVEENLRYADPESAEYTKLIEKREDLRKDLAKARDKERAAYNKWRGFEPDEELAQDRKKTHRLLSTAKTRLVTCQNKLAA